MTDISIHRFPAWLLLGIVLIQAPAALHAEPRWPQFRGPQANGRSNDENVPLRWSPEDVA